MTVFIIVVALSVAVTALLVRFGRATKRLWG